MKRSQSAPLQRAGKEYTHSGRIVACVERRGGLRPKAVDFSRQSPPLFTAGRKPAWLRVKAGGGAGYAKVKGALASCGLNTVCEEAKCPNRGECWSSGTATFMILGDTCTRGCRFCAVKTSDEGRPVDPEEPGRLAEAARRLGLRHVVVTSVDRDDLPDRGSAHFAECVRRLKAGGFAVEALIPDYVGAELARVIAAGPDVLAHNVEAVERLQTVRDARASYARSLRTLREAKYTSPGVST